MTTPEHGRAQPTPDGHHVVIDGRRWRATDPSIPAPLKQELVDELMTARRLVRSDPDTARPRVQDAKVSLGERGEPWWQPSPAGQRIRLGATIRSLLRHRNGTTVCPSDAARVVGGDQWRNLMPAAREVAIELAAQSIVRIQQKGMDIDPSDIRGPIRLAPGPAL